MGKQHQDSDITTLDDIPTLDECYGKYPKPTPGTSILLPSFSISFALDLASHNSELAFFEFTHTFLILYRKSDPNR
jgi:hypothetical protein